MTAHTETGAPVMANRENPTPPLSKDLILLKTNSGAGEGRHKAFEETEFTRDVRQLIEDWTALYTAHDIQPGGEYEKQALKAREATPVLRRYFTRGSFDLGGRYMGWWMDMKPDQRKEIRIDAEPVIELDFQCCGPRLAYALQGVAVKPHKDLYDLRGKTGKKCTRALVKEAFLTLLTTSSHRRHRIPPGVSMPSGVKFDNLMRVIEVRNPDLAPWFRKGRMAELERMESDITTLILKLFTYDLKRPILPVHDSFLVARRDERALALAMGYAFVTTVREWTGLYALPSIRGLSTPELETEVYQNLAQLKP